MSGADCGGAVTDAGALRSALAPGWLEDAAASLLAGPIGHWDEVVWLAGGWYTHLALRRPPRDLDLFFRDPHHLEAVASRILARGGRAQHDRPPFHRSMVWQGLTIELAYNVWCDSLADVLHRFDLGPSMVGVEWRLGTARAEVDALARASIERGMVLMHRDCENTKYALVSIERARCYAERLGMCDDAEGLARLWTVLAEADPVEQRRMIERYRRVGVRDGSIEARALAIVAGGAP